jgi:hypothetical protein
VEKMQEAKIIHFATHGLLVRDSIFTGVSPWPRARHFACNLGLEVGCIAAAPWFPAPGLFFGRAAAAAADSTKRWRHDGVQLSASVSPLSAAP